MSLATIAQAVWERVPRTLASGTPPPPSARTDFIAQAVWAYASRTLTLSSSSLSSEASFGFSSESSSSLVLVSDTSLISSRSSDLSSSTSSEIPPCDLFEAHPRGREGIGVTQPQSGTDFPLVQPSEDVRYLLADLHLQYAGNYQLPLHIAYLRGFGCILNEEPINAPPHAPGDWMQEHTADIVIADALGAIVFDSRDGAAADFSERDWGPRNHIFEWKTAAGLCRVVTHTKWSPDNEPEPRNYPFRLVPESAVLDERTLVQLPRRVDSLFVVLDEVTRRGVEFLPGYNMEITHQDTLSQRGGRVRHQIRFDAVVGAGQGIFPDCTAPPLVITRVNEVPPADGGDFFLGATDCYFVRQPTKILNAPFGTSRPYANLIPGNMPDEDLPDPLAGTTTSARGWPTSKFYAHLQLGNDCAPCCDCDDYLAVAQYMNRVRDDYKAVGNTLMATRGQYHQNRDRFNDMAQCLLRRPLRIFLQPQICPFLDVALQFANHSANCLSDLELMVTFSANPDDPATLVPGYTQIRGATLKPNRRTGLTERYVMEGSWPTFQASWAAVEPYAAVSVRFRLEFPDCFTPYIVTGSLTGTLGGEPIMVPTLSTGSLSSASSASAADSEEARASDTKTLACPAGEHDALDMLRCYRETLSSIAAQES